MKNLFSISLIGIPLALTSSLFAQALNWEIVPTEEDGFWNSVRLETVPGVNYQIQKGNNLQNWTLIEEVYGLGHPYYFPAYQVPTLPTSGQSTGGSPPVSSTKPMVNLTISRSSSSSSTVISWISLDHSNPVSSALSVTLDPAWDSTPLSVNTSDNDLYTFFIYHPSAAVPTPSPVDLGPLDQLLWTEFVASFANIEQQIVSNTNATAFQLHTPQSSPGSKQFFRIVTDWTIDSDGDGAPDWLEFQIAADPTHPSHSVANTFSSDTDGNGINDGSEIDSDNDNIPDDKDVSLNDPAVDWSKGPSHKSPRYAAFDMVLDASSSSPNPLMVNDQGIVLFATRVWSQGAFQDLTLETNEVEYCQAFGMNDNGQIIGTGSLKDPRDTLNVSPIVIWPDKTAAPIIAMKVIPGEDEEKQEEFAELAFDSNNIPHDNLLSNDLRFFAHMSDGQEISDEIKLWHYNLQNGTFNHQPADQPDLRYVADPSVSWGIKEGKTIIRGTAFDAPIDKVITRIGVRPEEKTTAYESNQFFIPSDSGWTPSEEFGYGIDGAHNGVLISDEDLWNNGNFEKLCQPTGNSFGAIQKYSSAPELDESWDEMTFLDSSPSGWLLGVKSDEDSKALVSLPVTVEDDVFATGVDNHSAAAQKAGSASEGRLWIMVPQGGSNTVTLQAPATSESVLTIQNPDSVRPATQTMDTSEVSITFTTPLNNQSSIDELAEFQLDSAISLSTPLGFKIMKKRVVTLTVWPVGLRTFDENNDLQIESPEIIPTEQEIANYLNDIYEPQINVTFDVDLRGKTSPLSAAWDRAGTSGAGNPPNGRFDTYSPELSPEETQVASKYYNQNTDINAYIIGGDSPKGLGFLIFDNESGQPIPDPVPPPLLGIAHPPTRTAWLSGSTREVNPENLDELKETLLNTLAHEIGHIMMGEGHPDQFDGPAPLPRTYTKARLMYSRSIKGESHRRLLIKGEWDKAEEWLVSRQK